jgi:hypothetical protein
MTHATNEMFPPTVRGSLPFAADRNDGGQFSNTMPELTAQASVSVEVEIANMRAMAPAPTLEREGFTVAPLLAGRLPWSNDPERVDAYVEACIELVRSLTGREAAVAFGPPVPRGDPGANAGFVAPRAHFVHLDNSRASAIERVRATVAPLGFDPDGATIFNVWRSITPPPQDVPIAVSDWRTVSEDDYVEGMTVEGGGFALPHLRLAPSARGPSWFYVPDLHVDEVVVFVGSDLDPAHPLGCAHCAFANPLVTDVAERRVSVEVRVIACRG